MSIVSIGYILRALTKSIVSLWPVGESNTWPPDKKSYALLIELMRCPGDLKFHKM